jgi:energy-coupling factor transporter ATP-binding protein EcfA2
VIAVRDVRFAYPDGGPALAGVSLDIRPGELVALVGRNGSGKTTLAKHLNGLLQPESGAVLLDGVDLRTLGIGAIARSVGFVFQDPDHQLFCATVREEIAYGPARLGLRGAELEQRVAGALEASGLAHRQSVDPFLLGKGERQRLAVAAVLALEPRVLVLDEPTTGLDHQEQLAVVDLLTTLHRAGRSVVVITHAAWLVAEHATRAVLLDAGRVLFDGPVPELFHATAALAAASFVLPDAVRLGLGLGIAARSADDLVRALGTERDTP